MIATLSWLFGQWWSPIVMRFFTANIATSILLKLLASSPKEPKWIIERLSLPEKFSVVKRQTLMFCFCMLWACIFAQYNDVTLLTPVILLPFLIGGANAFAVYAQWRAADFNLSKTSLLSIWDDIIIMTLSYYYLGEGRFLNAGVWTGIKISSIAFLLLVLHDYKKGLKEKEAHKNLSSSVATATHLKFYGYVLTYSVVWGVAIFLMRCFAIDKMPMGIFLPGWYGGTLTMFVFFFIKNVKKEPDVLRSQPLMKHEKWLLFLASASIILSLALNYIALERTPATIVTPIYFVAEMIISTFVGLFVFKEHKRLDWQEWIYFGIAIVGGLMVGLNYAG